MTTEIINRIDLTSWNMIVDDTNVFGAVKYVLESVMGSWLWVIFTVVTLIAVYVRTHSLSYTAGLGLIMTLLMFEIPAYFKWPLYLITAFGIGMALFKVFGKRDAG